MPSPKGPGSGSLDIEEAVLGLIARGAVKIPPYPAVALKLNQIVNRENYGLPDILAVVSSDQALTTDVLRCANSAFFGKGEVTSVQQAVGRIGSKEVVRLALASGLAASARGPGALATLKRQVWEGSVASAVICQVLARVRGLRQDDAFVCGLLHDFGWMIGILAVEEVLAAHPDYPARPESFWMAMLEKWHTRLGQSLAARWKLPEVFQDSIWLHHSPKAAESAHAKMIALVAASDVVVALLAAHPTVGDAELQQVAALSPSERQLLAATLPDVPMVIAAFEAEPRGPQAESKVEQPETSLPAGYRPLEATVNQVNPRKRGPYGMIGITANGWVMRGREALPENQLLEAQLLVEPHALRLWAKPTLCKPDGAGFIIECKPFALNGPTLAVWSGLFNSAQKA